MTIKLLGILIFTCSLAYCQTEILVSSAATDGHSQVLRFSSKDGHFLGTFSCTHNPDDPRGMRQRPPNREVIYINSANDEVLAYSTLTGSFLGVFASHPDLNGGAGVFGPDFNYYVGSRTLGAVVRFDSKSGAFVDNFVKQGSVKSIRGFDFAPDGNLYIADGLAPTAGVAGTIVKADGQTGNVLDPHFVNDPELSPLDLVIGPDGQIYVTSEFPFGAPDSRGTVRRYDLLTGKLLAVFDPGKDEQGQARLSKPRGIFFGPDGLMYVSSTGTDSVVRFDWQTGKFIDTFIHYPQLNGQAVSIIPAKRDGDHSCQDGNQKQNED